MQYVRNFDKSIRFNTALNLARDEKSISTGRLFQGLTTRLLKKIITYIVIRLFNNQFITMTTSASSIGRRKTKKCTKINIC